MKIRIRGKTVLLLFVAVALLIVSVQPVMAGPTIPNLSIADGEWEGTLSAFYLYDFNGASSGSWDWSGDMHFFSTGGELTGDAVVSGTGTGETTTAMALATLNAEVAITGPSFAPLFQATNGAFEVTANASGFSTTVTIPISGADTVPVPIKLLTATCSQVDGHWDDFVNQFASSNGFTVSNLTTLFAAVRTADLAPEGQTSYKDLLADLVGQANDFLSELLNTTSFDVNKFEYLLTTAEELAISLNKNNDCGFTNEWSFALPIANLVADVIDFAYKHPDYFTPQDIFDLTDAAVRAGVIGAGAVNPDLANEVKSKLNDLITNKLNDLDSAGGNCQVIMPLFTASHDVGGTAVQTADSLFAKYGCG